MLGLRRGQALSAKRADIEPRRGATHEQGQAFLSNLNLGSNRAGRLNRRAGTEGACPSAEPLVESLRTDLPVLVANVAAVARKRPVKRSDNF